VAEHAVQTIRRRTMQHENDDAILGLGYKVNHRLVRRFNQRQPEMELSTLYLETVLLSGK